MANKNAVLEEKETHHHLAEEKEHHGKSVAPPAITKDVPDITPLVVAGIGDLILDPDAVQGTRFSGPVISGAPEDGAAGIAMLHKRAKITFAHGNFSIPVKFPPSTILVQWIIQIQQSYNGATPKINLGNAVNGVDINSADVSVAPTQVYGNFGILGSNWTIWLSQVVSGATQGKATVLITYSVPAKTVAS